MRYRYSATVTREPGNAYVQHVEIRRLDRWTGETETLGRQDTLTTIPPRAACAALAERLGLPDLAWLR